jgi:hypothetical protein
MLSNYLRKIMVSSSGLYRKQKLAIAFSNNQVDMRRRLGSNTHVEIADNALQCIECELTFPKRHIFKYEAPKRAQCQ